MNQIEFAELTKEETVLMEKILKRAEPLFENKINPEEITTHIGMNLRAVHAVCPLDFRKLHGFNDFSFAHDIIMIDMKLNKETGELEEFFLPRCAKPQSN
ncbi:MAG: hypothetical protein G3M70_07170 [Candidatus Nitronauta litoralis]|uniref:DUF6874 domain-containing protein n=1 Tax=Candidatus Nitronauta litoralis TaxID=2705533 RepID=A0A7T0BVP1_9BACT|nr:MAG: hypothetical protein G3M70_07170 [Candidatus Nitronauta litoralis]